MCGAEDRECRVCGSVCRRNGNRGRIPDYCCVECRRFQEHIDAIETLLPSVSIRMDLANKSLLRGLFWAWGNYFRIPKHRASRYSTYKRKSKTGETHEDL